MTHQESHRAPHCDAAQTLAENRQQLAISLETLCVQRSVGQSGSVARRSEKGASVGNTHRSDTKEVLRFISHAWAYHVGGACNRASSGKEEEEIRHGDRITDGDHATASDACENVESLHMDRNLVFHSEDKVRAANNFGV